MSTYCVEKYLLLLCHMLRTEHNDFEYTQALYSLVFICSEFIIYPDTCDQQFQLLTGRLFNMFSKQMQSQNVSINRGWEEWLVISIYRWRL